MYIYILTWVIYILFGTLIAAYEPPLKSAEINYQDFIT